MSMMQFDEPSTRLPSIRVVGVGGGGGNAVRNMVEAGVDGVEYLVVNTDRQVLENSPVAARIQIGNSITRGLGAGADPNVGHKAALEDQARIADAMQNCEMAVITVGLGGGTGTGAAPVVAKLARERGVLTVAVVTMPFAFEGRRRMNIAQQGLEALRGVVDTILVIPNDRVLAIAEPGTRFRDAFKLIDNVVLNAVQSISEIITTPGYVNVDFNDVRTIMQSAGRALMGTGRASGPDRARDAAELAVASPLLDGANIEGATGILICVTGGDDLEIHEVNEAAQIIQAAAHPDANIIWGTAFDPSLEGEVKVTVIATGFDREPMPVSAGFTSLNSVGAPAVGNTDRNVTRAAPAEDPFFLPDARYSANWNAAPAPAQRQVSAPAVPAQTLPGLDRPAYAAAPSELRGAPVRQARVSQAHAAVGEFEDYATTEAEQPGFVRRRLDDFRR